MDHQRSTVWWCMQHAPASTLVHANARLFTPLSTAPYIFVPPSRLTIDTINQSTRHSTARISSIISQSQSQSQTQTTTNESNYDSSVIRRVHFPTLHNVHHPNNDDRSTLLDHLDYIVFNLHTSPKVNQSNVLSTSGFENELNHPSISYFFPAFVNVDETPSPVNETPLLSTRHPLKR